MNLNNFIGIVVMVFITVSSNAQTTKTAATETKTPASCKMYLNGAVKSDITVEDALAWCDLTPPTVQCDDGKIYFLQSFLVSFFTMKPLQNKDFGIGEGGIPIMARNAVSKGMTGDALVLKEVNCIDSEGNKILMPVISFKLK